MQQWLDRCMTGNFEKKHILPFFWQHGETRDVLEEEYFERSSTYINAYSMLEPSVRACAKAHYTAKFRLQVSRRLIFIKHK